jgi:hypothetical protein
MTARSFRQADYVRAVKAARAAGLAVERTEIALDGRIVLIHKGDSGGKGEPLGPYDAWKANGPR